MDPAPASHQTGNGTIPAASGWICASGMCPAWGQPCKGHSSPRGDFGVLGRAGDGGCPIPIPICCLCPIPCPPTGGSVQGGWVKALARSPMMRFPKRRSCLPSDTAPHSLGMNGGGCACLGSSDKYQLCKAAFSAQPCLHNIPGQGETEAEPIYSWSRSLPVRTSLSKGSCNWRRSSRAEFASLRYDKIF